MAIGPYVSGPVLVKVNLRDGNGLLPLGYTEDGIQVQHIPMYRDIFSDRNGGVEGSPIDRQFMSEQARLPIQLVEFEPQIMRRMLHIIAGDGSLGETTREIGELPPAGGLQAAENVAFQVVLIGSKDQAALVTDPVTSTAGNDTDSGAQVITPLNYLNCFFDGPIEMMAGSKNSMPSFEFRAFPITADGVGGDGKQRLFITRNETAYDDPKVMVVT